MLITVRRCAETGKPHVFEYSSPSHLHPPRPPAPPHRDVTAAPLAGIISEPRAGVGFVQPAVHSAASFSFCVCDIAGLERWSREELRKALTPPPDVRSAFAALTSFPFLSIYAGQALTSNSTSIAVARRLSKERWPERWNPVILTLVQTTAPDR